MSEMTKEMQGRMVLAASAGEHGLVAQQLAELLISALEDAERYRALVTLGDGRVHTMFNGMISWIFIKGDKEATDRAVDVVRSHVNIRAQKGEQA